MTTGRFSGGERKLMAGKPIADGALICGSCTECGKYYAAREMIQDGDDDYGSRILCPACAYAAETAGPAQIDDDYDDDWDDEEDDWDDEQEVSDE